MTLLIPYDITLRLTENLHSESSIEIPFQEHTLGHYQPNVIKLIQRV